MIWAVAVDATCGSVLEKADRKLVHAVDLFRLEKKLLRLHVASRTKIARVVTGVVEKSVSAQCAESIEIGAVVSGPKSANISGAAGTQVRQAPCD